MLHFAHGASIARTELFQHYQVLATQVQFELDANLEGIMAAFIVAEGTWDLRVAGRWSRVRIGRSSTESEAFDVFALERPLLESVGHDLLESSGTRTRDRKQAVMMVGALEPDPYPTKILGQRKVATMVERDLGSGPSRSDCTGG